MATQSNSRPPRVWTTDFILLILVQFTYGTSFSSFFILPKYLLEAQQADASLIGYAHGAFAAAGVLCVPILGPALDRWDKKAMLVAGLALGVVSFAPFSWVSHPALILGLRVLHGISFSMVFNAGSALTVELAPSERRAEAIGYFGLAMMSTNALGPFLAELLAHHFGWVSSFYACSLYALLGLLCAIRLQSALGSTHSTNGTSALTIGLIGTYLGTTALGVGVGATKTFIPALLVEEGLPRIAPYFLAYTLGAMMQRTAFGRLPDRMGYLPASVAAFLLYGFTMALILVVPAPWILWVGAGIGIAHGLGYPAVNALSMSLGDQRVRGRIAAWSTGGFNLGFALSTAGLGPLEPELGYRGLVAVGGSFLLISAGVLPLFIQAHRRRRHDSLARPVP